MIEQFLRESQMQGVFQRATQHSKITHLCHVSCSSEQLCSGCGHNRTLLTGRKPFVSIRHLVHTQIQSTTHGVDIFLKQAHKKLKSNCYFSSAILTTVFHMSNRVTQYQVADGGSVHVVDQSRQNEDQRRRVGGTLVVSRLCEPLEGREGGKRSGYLLQRKQGVWC